jgi:hypothetical protein
MTYEYYEIIAADLFGIKPESLWMRSRERNKVVIPRQFCMKYRIDVLKLSQADSAGRYNREHATAISASKKIDNYIETKDEYGLMYLDFLKKCEKERQRINQCSKEHKEQFIRNVENIGLSNYTKTVKEQFDTLIKFVCEDEEEDLIREQIKICSVKLRELKFLYQLEDEPKL